MQQQSILRARESAADLHVLGKSPIHYGIAQHAAVQLPH
jgi:hypothetical protein